MKTHRLFIALTIVNLGLLIFLLAQIRRVGADSLAPVLHGRELEIVDEQGRVRASIKAHPADLAGYAKALVEQFLSEPVRVGI
jgi:hypothetical protein